MSDLQMQNQTNESQLSPLGKKVLSICESLLNKRTFDKTSIDFKNDSHKLNDLFEYMKVDKITDDSNLKDYNIPSNEKSLTFPKVIEVKKTSNFLTFNNDLKLYTYKKIKKEENVEECLPIIQDYCKLLNPAFLIVLLDYAITYIINIMLGIDFSSYKGTDNDYYKTIQQVLNSIYSFYEIFPNSGNIRNLFSVYSIYSGKKITINLYTNINEKYLMAIQTICGFMGNLNIKEKYFDKVRSPYIVNASNNKIYATTIGTNTSMYTAIFNRFIYKILGLSDKDYKIIYDEHNYNLIDLYLLFIYKYRISNFESFYNTIYYGEGNNYYQIKTHNILSNNKEIMPYINSLIKYDMKYITNYNVLLKNFTSYNFLKQLFNVKEYYSDFNNIDKKYTYYIKFIAPYIFNIYYYILNNIKLNNDSLDNKNLTIYMNLNEFFAIINKNGFNKINRILLKICYNIFIALYKLNKANEEEKNNILRIIKNHDSFIDIILDYLYEIVDVFKNYTFEKFNTYINDSYKDLETYIKRNLSKDIMTYYYNNISNSMSYVDEDIESYVIIDGLISLFYNKLSTYVLTY